MTAEQFDIIRAIIKSAYPSFNIMPDKYSIKLWYTMLGDLDYSLCETALQELIATHTYPPQISEIRAKCAEPTTPQLKDAGEAWEDVQKAIQKYGYYRSDEAMESLSGPTKQAVERIGFRELCYGDNPVANRAHFFKIYDAIVERAVNESMVPAAVLEKKREYIGMIEEKVPEKPKIEQKTEEPFRPSSPEFIDRLMREKGLR